MSDVKFSNNYRDLCRREGVDAGFQFEFYCERCQDTWRTPFSAYRKGQVSGWLGRAAGIFGGVLGDAGRAADGFADAGFGEARDEAFKEAIESAKQHFHRCAKCYQYVCDPCWDTSKGLCRNCAPDAKVHGEAAKAQGLVQAVEEAAHAEGRNRAGSIDVKADKQLVCPACGTETHGAKFCPGCGAKLAAQAFCRDCGAQLAPGAKFCGDCGSKASDN